MSRYQEKFPVTQNVKKCRQFPPKAKFFQFLPNQFFHNSHTEFIHNSLKDSRSGIMDHHFENCSILEVRGDNDFSRGLAPSPHVATGLIGYLKINVMNCLGLLITKLFDKLYLIKFVLK